jgi:hypothetical protein
VGGGRGRGGVGGGSGGGVRGRRGRAGTRGGAPQRQVSTSPMRDGYIPLRVQDSRSSRQGTHDT